MNRIIIYNSIFTLFMLCFYNPSISQYNWNQIGNDFQGISSHDELGHSVSLSSDGTVLAIGIPGDNSYSGQVQVFTNNSGAWVQKGNNIVHPVSAEKFGISVCLSDDGNTIVVGDNQSNNYTGFAEVYRFNGSDWVQKGSTIHGDAYFDRFGQTVCISSDGNIIAIGAPTNDGNGNESGQVKIYEYMSNDWVQVGNDLYGQAISDKFGTSISLSSDGNTIAIGVPGYSYYSNGKVIVYRNYNGYWIPKGNMFEGENVFKHIGESISISDNGNIIAIGATDNNSKVRVYKYINGEWSIIGKDINRFNADVNAMKKSIDLDEDGNTVIIGETGYDNARGRVSVFHYSGNDWINVTSRIQGYDDDDALGFSVSISSDGHTIAMSAPYFSTSSIYNYEEGIVRAFNIDSFNVIGINTFCSSYTSPNNNTYNNSGIYYETDSVNGNLVIDLIADNWQQIGDDFYGSNNSLHYGNAISLNADGNIIAIGNESMVSTGWVWVYQYDEYGNWIPMGDTIKGDIQLEHLGSSVSLSEDGKTLAVGCRRSSVNDYGRVKVFQYVNNTWSLKGNVVMSNYTYDYFGGSVSLSADGNTFIVGAYGYDSYKGYAGVYTFNGSLWTQKGTFIFGESNYDDFGTSVSISDDGNTVAIGAPINTGSWGYGYAKVYEFNGTMWLQKGSNLAGVGYNNHFGNSVCLSADGNIVAIGAPFKDNSGNEGYVDTYFYNGSGWQQMDTIVAGEIIDERFGISVSLSSDGKRMVAGAPGEYSGSGGSYGEARIYDFIGPDSTGYWVKSNYDTIIGDAPFDYFGIAVEMSSDGNFFAAGAIGHDLLLTDDGQVKVFSTVNPNVIKACNSYTSPGGNTYTLSGIYYDTIPGINSSCDSIVKTFLMIGDNNTSSAIVPVVCDQSYYVSPSSNYIWTMSGTYTDTLVNSTGCDSIISIDLTFVTIDTSITVNDSVLTANYSGASYQWIDCDNGNSSIANETNQSYTAQATGNYAVVISMNGCTDTSSCYEIVVDNSSIDDFNVSPKIVIMPNPTKGVVHILSENIIKSEVIDVNGNTLPINLKQDMTIDLSNKPKGIYFIKVITTKGVAVNKVLLL